MKSTQPPHRRAFAALVPATLLLVAPAFAQEAATPPVPTAVTPPPVVPTLPQASAPAAGPQPLTNGVAARNGIGDPNSATPIAPEAIAQAEEARAARSTTARTAPRSAPQRATPPRQATAPVAASPAPTVVTPAPATPPVAAAPEAAPATTPAETPAQTATTDATTTDAITTGAPVWPWIVGGLVVLAALFGLFLRRRNRVEQYEEVYEEPVYVEPVAQTAAEPAVITPVAAAPVAEQRQAQGTRLEPQFLRTAPVAAPVVAAVVAGTAAQQADAVAVEAELVEPEAEDVAALTAGSDHGDRPWLEFAMRPVRAGSNADDALVEIELTVGNSGAVAAEDVRISTFMFADGSATTTEMERLLTAHAADSEVSPVTIAAGEGTRVDATLSLSKDHLGDETQAFNPVIVADARYRLADGSEGRTCASFTIGRTADEGEEMGGIAIHRQQMSDDIEARLHGVPAHA